MSGKKLDKYHKHFELAMDIVNDKLVDDVTMKDASTRIILQCRSLAILLISASFLDCDVDGPKNYTLDHLIQGIEHDNTHKTQFKIFIGHETTTSI
jgi:hypothetical protein